MVAITKGLRRRTLEWWRVYTSVGLRTVGPITAIAPIEGTIKIAECKAFRAVPMMQWAALSDTNSPFGGGPTDTSVPYTVSVHLSTAHLPPYSMPTTSQVVTSNVMPTVTDTMNLWVARRYLKGSYPRPWEELRS